MEQRFWSVIAMVMLGDAEANKGRSLVPNHLQGTDDCVSDMLLQRRR